MHVALLFLVAWTVLAVNDPSLPKPNDHGVIELTPATWSQVVMSEKYDVVVEFYSPYCIYCQELEPVWNQLGEKFKNEDSVIISRIDYSKQDNHIEGYMVRGVPTIMMFPAKSKVNPPTFHNQRTLNNFIQWIMDTSQHKIDVPVHHKSLPKPANNDGPVITVVGETWQDIVMNKDKHVFVNFFAPWCPFSQRLTPIWKDLAQSLKDYPNLVIADFDGTQNEVPGVNLHAFPTTTLYRKGDKAQFQFRGPTRSVEAYTEWLRANIPDAFNAHRGSPEEVKKEKEEGKAVLDKHKAFDDDHLVPEITEAAFLDAIQSPQKNIVVLFYADWDEHKEQHKDIWDDVALDYQFVNSILFYQMDASKAPKTGVTVFPSIKIFPAPQLTRPLHELKREAAWGVQEKVDQLSALSQKAAEWQQARFHDTDTHQTAQRHWRKLTTREKEHVLAAARERVAAQMPSDFDELWKDPLPVESVTFKGKDITVENIKEFIQTNSNPTKEDIVVSLARGVRSEQPIKRNTNGEQAYQTMIYKEDL